MPALDISRQSILEHGVGVGPKARNEPSKDHVMVKPKDPGTLCYDAMTRLMCRPVQHVTPSKMVGIATQMLKTTHQNLMETRRRIITGFRYDMTMRALWSCSVPYVSSAPVHGYVKACVCACVHACQHAVPN
jgi:hypothetical protein